MTNDQTDWSLVIPRTSPELHSPSGVHRRIMSSTPLP
jgi:hypothetical protein